ncbi:MAG TPA: two-component regulator propeller domain-containing protein, partial [Candidatus Wallbacteria bacterium]|nr:two-component regulator propeller domain-containing protein [Candidatus Wallbacteria bacterium]
MVITKENQPFNDLFFLKIFAVLMALLAVFYPATSRASSFRHMLMEDGLVSNTITCIATDKTGNVWVGTIDGIARYNNNGWEKFTVENGCLKDNAIWAIGVDEGKSYSKIWFGTGFGLAVFENNHWTHYVGAYENQKTKKREEGNCPVESNVINKIFVSKNTAAQDKNIIYVVAGGKLYKFNGEKWSTFDFPKDILKTSSITSISSKGDDTLWLGTSGQGLLEFNIGQMKLTTYTKKEGIPSDYVTALYASPEGKVYIGTENGLGIMERGNCAVFNYRNSKLVSDYITAIQSGVFGNIAIATDKGLNMYDGKDFMPLPANLSVLNGQVVWSMALSSLPGNDYSQFWIGTRGTGAYLYQVSKDAKANVQEDQTRTGMRTFNEKKYEESLAAWEEVLKVDEKNRIIFSAARRNA